MTEAPAIPDEHVLRDMLDAAIVNKLLDAFGRVCNVGAGFFTPNAVRIGKPAHHNAFCSCVYSTPEGERRCAKCDGEKAESYRQSPNDDCVPYHCHAGLIDFCVPIKATVNGANRLIGLFFAGQVLFEEEQRPTREDVESLRNLARDCGLEFHDLLACYMQVPRVPRTRIDEIRNLMKHFAVLVGELVQKKAAAQDLLLDIIQHGRDGASVVEAIRRNLSPAAVSIFLERSEGELQPPHRIHLVATTYERFPKDWPRLAEERPMEWSYGPGEGFTGWVYDTGQLLYVPDCWDQTCYPDKPYRPTWRHRVQEVPQLEDTKAFLGVPIRDDDGRTIGVIRAIRVKGDRADQQESFTEDERELLKGAASLVSAAFQRAQENQRLIENQARAARAGEVEIINDMMIKVALAKRYSDAAQSILDAAMRMVPCALGWLVLSRGIGGSSRFQVEACGPPGVQLNRDHLDRAFAERKGIVYHVIATGKAFCGNVPEDAQRNGVSYVECREGIRSELAVPMLLPCRAAPEGAINLESDKPDAFSQEDIKRLEMLAGYAAVTLHSARQILLSQNIIATGAAWFDQAVYKLESLLLQPK